ncbi:hypothetical protein [Pontibacterium sp.]|uniref:hypothetical protein n=1 Tax=Pontibacterium sp. TaxID=2036026 RepID=UPI00356387D2
MESKTLFKTDGVEVQQSSRGAISFGYTDSTDAMFDLYARIAELEMQVVKVEHERDKALSDADKWSAAHDGVEAERNQLETHNERLRSELLKFRPFPHGNFEYMEGSEGMGESVEQLLAESPAASLAEIQAQAVNSFAQEVGVFDAEYDDQEYVEIPRYKVREYIEQIRQQAQEASQ